jgi:hypothetical protein
MLRIHRREMTEQERARILAARPGWVARRIFTSLGRVLASQIDRDLESGLVEVLDVEVARLGVAEPHGDEGPLLFCDTAAGWTIGLVGQWLYDSDLADLDESSLGDAEICRHFELVRAPFSGVPLHLSCIGDVEPILPEVRLEIGRIKYLPETFLVRGTLESMVSNLPLLDEG